MKKDCYVILKIKKDAIRNEKGDAAAADFDIFCQETGLIFPPYDSDGVFANAFEAWEAKRQSLESPK